MLRCNTLFFCTSHLCVMRGRSVEAAVHGARCLSPQVDGVSSIGALPFEMDNWGVDVAVTGSQKALSLPTGLAVVAISEKVELTALNSSALFCQELNGRSLDTSPCIAESAAHCSLQALAAREKAGLTRKYWDWDWQLPMNKQGQVPYTPSIPLLFGLRETLNLLKDEGIANVVKRHQE